MNLSQRPRLLLMIVATGLVVLSILAWYFQPWRLFTNTTVSEALPTAGTEISAEQIPSKTSPATSSTRSNLSENSDPDLPVEFPLVLREGSFISHEHQTSGKLLILELENGDRILRIENLDTSDGPDLEIWLSDAPVIQGIDGWRVFDDGNYLSLGKLKGNLGDQNYEIPAEVDLEDFSSVSIWCVRFAVSFGAAEL